LAATITIILSLLALTISAITAWLTLLRRGTVRMTLPSTIFFGPDGGQKSLPKVYLRTLLYGTSKRGRIVESMFVRLRRGQSSQTFNIWVYGNDSLQRGSGIFVGENGVACNHHFLLPPEGTKFEFLAGTYLLEVFASLVGSRHTLRLFSVNLMVTEEIAKELRRSENGLYFDWGPDSNRYHPHVEMRPRSDLSRLFRGVQGESNTVFEE